MPKFKNDLSIITIPYVTHRINTSDRKPFKDIVKKTPKHSDEFLDHHILTTC
ncbi:MAG: hypothetical protein SAK29_05505 [Scytonema sp. PMC 1069.18]|nr:hypothetical protein [Scytonema sp. PMC 1069.18]MEC4881289.1 hypothetical protein [Scytonema sp. PMC 1070.18]